MHQRTKGFEKRMDVRFGKQSRSYQEETITMESTSVGNHLSTMESSIMAKKGEQECQEEEK